MKNLTKFASVAVLSMMITAKADAAWVINEIMTDTTGSPDSSYCELYNSTPNASVAGLTLINIRSSTFIATTSINLTGSATGNYYLIGSAAYASAAPGLGKPAPDATLVTGLRTGFWQTVLVNTADVPAGFTSSPTTYVFANTDFSNGAQLIDSLQFTDNTDPTLWTAFNTKVFRNSPTNTLQPYGANRFPDGTGAWVGNYTLGTSPGISPEGTPRTANTFNGTNGVNDWSMY